MKTALTIAGSDSSGGAGIQADIKTMITNGVYAMSAITALTAQNTTGVEAIFNVTPEFLGQELDCIFKDIYPDAVKIGMVSDKELIRMMAMKLKQYKAKNIAVEGQTVTNGRKQKPLDEVDLAQMSFLDTVKDDDIIEELRCLDISQMTPIEALNALNELQVKVRNRW